jgi:hypothetical protein
MAFLLLLQDYLRDPELHLPRGVEQGGSRLPCRRVGPRLCHVRSPRRSAALRNLHAQGETHLNQCIGSVQVLI